CRLRDAREFPGVQGLRLRLCDRRRDLLGEACAWRAECDGRRMLQCAVCAVLEEKVVLWPRGSAEDRNRLTSQLLYARDERRRVEGRRARERQVRDAMRHAVDHEDPLPKLSC